jgi:hypothetical protein
LLGLAPGAAVHKRVRMRSVDSESTMALAAAASN